MGFQTLDLAAYPAMRYAAAADDAIREAREEGWYVASGCAISASGTTGKLDMAAGVVFAGTTELNAAAQTAIATTITSIADSTNPKLVLIELDTSNVVQFNQGTAAAFPLWPALTASRVVLAGLYVPAGATAVDALLTTANGNAKIMDKRVLVSVHYARLFGEDHAQTTQTNPTTTLANAGSSLLASTKSVPANSLNVGDTFVIESSVAYSNTQNASTLQLELLLGATVLGNVILASLATSGFPRGVMLRSIFQVKTIGTGTSAVVLRNFFITVSGTGVAIVSESDNAQGTASTGFDSTAAQAIDLQARIATSSTTATVQLVQFSIIKYPV